METVADFLYIFCIRIHSRIILMDSCVASRKLDVHIVN